ncbi:ATP-binding protein [Streptomyces sp. LHD-70]|uniref:ATP-binding protein n=1 Tax=Streptomyces sp. LHD-70 TaxID=3072140 RepID=UPI00280FCEF9|nr:ATP-binding protein [Streptomyces sp. LHD-70]MDQ8706997.1 ATP-binding protein [Streptomyces sp. LHD-70]
MSSEYAPHPHIGGRTSALRALAAWRMEWPGTPRVIVVTGDPGSGASRLVSGFLMMCDAGFRSQLPLDDMDPSTVPPELPPPAVPDPQGLTAAQLLWLVSDYHGLKASTVQEVFAQLSARQESVTVVVPDVDRAGPVRSTNEPARVVREVLRPLAECGTVRILVDVPREFVAELTDGLPAGTAQVIDLDQPDWADPDGLVLHAATALDPELGAPELPFTTDGHVRTALASAIGRRAGTSPLLVQLAVQSALLVPDGFEPGDESGLPSSVGEAMDLHAARSGVEPRVLRQLLAPLALAEGPGLPMALWPQLVTALAGADMSEAVQNGMLLVGPFVELVEVGASGEAGAPGRALIRLLHPALGTEIRAWLPQVRTAQSQFAMALLAAVPGQDWSKADPYVRDHIAGHTLEAGLLPQLLTDPGLFVYADPVSLRTAVEAVPVESLGAPARAYLRVAPLLTRIQADAALRAAVLESAFVEDGLPEYAAAVRRLGLDLPWETLWSLRVDGIHAATVGTLQGPDGQTVPVAALAVPQGTPGAVPVPGPGESALLVHGLLDSALPANADARQVLRPTEEERAASPFEFSGGADYLRIWDRVSEELLAVLVSDEPITGADLSPEGVLLFATGRGARALRILPPAGELGS